MSVRIGGEPMYLWRAVNDEGEVLQVLVQRQRNKAAARRLMRRLPKKRGFAPTVVTTDKLRSYGPSSRHWASRPASSKPCGRTTGPRFPASQSADGSARCNG